MDTTAALPIPYFSQWEFPDLVSALLSGEIFAADDPGWADSGATPPAMPLKDDCVDAGAYVVDGTSVKGLIYAPFVRCTTAKWDLAAEVVTTMGLTEVGELVQRSNPVMISLYSSVREPTGVAEGKGGHLVLAIGSSPDGLTLHNPSGLPGRSQKSTFVGYAVLDQYYAERGVVYHLSSPPRCRS